MPNHTRLVLILLLCLSHSDIFGQGRLELTITSGVDSTGGSLSSKLVNVDLSPLMDSIDLKEDYTVIIYLLLDSDCIRDSSCAMDSFYFESTRREGVLNLATRPKIQKMIISFFRDVPIQFIPEQPKNLVNTRRLLRIPISFVSKW